MSDLRSLVIGVVLAITAEQSGTGGTSKQIESSTKMTEAQYDYAARKAHAEKLIARLTAALASHEAKASQQPTNWGHAGDLGALNNALIDALDRVGGLTSSEREQHRL